MLADAAGPQTATAEVCRHFDFPTEPEPQLIWFYDTLAYVETWHQPLSDACSMLPHDDWTLLAVRMPCRALTLPVHRMT